MSYTEVPVWPGWQIERKIGEGSFGTVYEIHRQNGKYLEKSAMKWIRVPRDRAQLEQLRQEGLQADNTEEYFASHVEEIRSEIAVMQQLTGDTNIVSCQDYEIIRHEGGPVWDILIRMELLTPLTEYEKQVGRPLYETEIISLGLDISRALAICHNRGILHRDVKPKNIFVHESGAYKLGDFGLARPIPGSDSVFSLKGTMAYMAPEIYAMRGMDVRSDIYSLAMVLYRLLNGNREPFLSSAGFTSSEFEVAKSRRLSGEPLPPPPRGSAVLCRVLSIALSADPGARYQSAAAFHEALEEVSAMRRENAQEDGTVTLLKNPAYKIRNTDAGNSISSPDGQEKNAYPNDQGSQEKNTYPNDQGSLENRYASYGTDLSDNAFGTGFPEDGFYDREEHVPDSSKADDGFVIRGGSRLKETAEEQLEEEDREEEGDRKISALRTCLLFAGIILAGLITGWFFMQSRQAEKPAADVASNQDEDPAADQDDGMMSEQNEDPASNQDEDPASDQDDDLTADRDDDLTAGLNEDMASEQNEDPASDQDEDTTAEDLTPADEDAETETASANEAAGEEALLNEPVVFADPALEAAVRKALPVPNGIITKRLALEQTELDLSGAGKEDSEKITDLTGLSEFANLEKLILRNNRITDVSELRTLTRLTKLNLEGNAVSDLTPLSGMHDLASLDLYDNQISDITPITSLTRVRMLDLRKNRITSIRGIGGMYSIDELYLGRNQITDISPVAALQNLVSLGFGYNQVEDISALKDLTMLSTLTMNGNRIRDISPVAGMQKLSHLEIAGNPIEDYSPLDSLPENVKIQR